MEGEDIFEKLTSQVNSELERMTLNEDDILRSLIGDVFAKKVFREGKAYATSSFDGPQKMEVIPEESESLFAQAIKEASLKASVNVPAIDSSQMNLEELATFFNATKPDTSRGGRSSLLATIQERKKKILERKQAKLFERQPNQQFEFAKPQTMLDLKQLDFAPKKLHNQNTHLRAPKPEEANIHDLTVKMIPVDPL